MSDLNLPSYHLPSHKENDDSASDGSIINEQIKDLIENDLGDGEELLMDDDDDDDDEEAEDEKYDGDGYEDWHHTSFQHFNYSDISHTDQIITRRQVLEATQERSYTDAEKWQLQQKQRLHDHHRPQHFYDSSDLIECDDAATVRKANMAAEEAEEVEEVGKSVRFSAPLFSPVTVAKTTTAALRSRTSTPKVKSEDGGQHIVRYKKAAESNRKQLPQREDVDDSSFYGTGDGPGVERRGGDADDNGDGDRIRQLEILYKARGKRVDELNKQLTLVTEQFERDSRIHAHELKMSKDEAKACALKVESLDRELADKQLALQQHEQQQQKLLQQQADDRKKQLKTEGEVELLEQTLDELRSELASLKRGEAMSRERDECEQMVAASRQQHEKEMLTLERKLHHLNLENEHLKEECEKLREDLRNAQCNMDHVVVEKTDIINQLTSNLQQAQQQCQSLLAGGGDVPYLKQLVEELGERNGELEDKLQLEQRTVEDLEEQITSYEMCLQLGNNPDEYKSFYDLLPAKQNQTQQQGGPLATATPSQESLVERLRKELERALATNKEKREKVRLLEDRISELGDELARTKQEVTQKAKVTGEQQTQTACWEEEGKKKLEKELEEASGEKEKMETEVEQLKLQLFQTIEVHDQDKKEALERREAALIVMYDEKEREVTRRLQEEQKTQARQVEQNNQQVINDLRDSNSKLLEELSQVKSSYVQVCADLKKLEADLNHDFKKKLSDMSRQHESELNSIEQKLMEEKKKSDCDFNNLLNSKISAERVTWEREEEKVRREAEMLWLSRVDVARRETEEKLLEQFKEEQQKQAVELEACRKASAEMENLKQNLQLKYHSKLQRIQESVTKTEHDMEMKWNHKLQQLENSERKKLDQETKRCEDYEQQVESLKRDLLMSSDEGIHRIRELQERHKKETQVLKNRITGEYRRWKKERVALTSKIDKLEREKNEFKKGSDDKQRYAEIFSQLQQVYISSLFKLKEEMKTYITENRLRTVQFLDKNL